MARVECLVKNTVDLFMDYADADGKMCKDKMKEMLEKEIENPEVKAKLCAADCKDMKECDGNIDIEKFCQCLSRLAKCCHEKKTGKGQDCGAECTAKGRLECIVKTTVELFMDYADADGKMCKDKMKEMLEKEIENPEIKAKLCAADCKDMKECDGNIDIEKFCQCLSRLVKCCHEKKIGKGQDCGAKCE